MPSLPTLALETQCKRIAALSMAIQHIMGSSNAREALELAEALDAHFGWEPFNSGDPPNDIAKAALGCLRVAGPENLERAIEKLPVFPLAAHRALEVTLRRYWNAWDLELVAGSDQALAANLLRAANSALYYHMQPIQSIPQAITYMGEDRTLRVLYAAAIQPVFASPALRDLWHHSVASAGVAQALANATGVVDPKKAFLAGLVHDVGVLAMMAFPAPFREYFSQLTKFGCEQIFAERVLAGLSHAEAGAQALKVWKFPGDFSEAVEFHHAPEQTQNKLASLLYLAEQWTDSSEDAPSAARFQGALKSIQLTEEQFSALAPESDESLEALL